MSSYFALSFTELGFSYLCLGKDFLIFCFLIDDNEGVEDL